MEEIIKTKDEILKEFFTEIIEDVLDATIKSTSFKISESGREILIKKWSDRILRR